MIYPYLSRNNKYSYNIHFQDKVHKVYFVSGRGWTHNHIDYFNSVRLLKEYLRMLDKE